MQSLLIDDASGSATALGTQWRLVSDRVMGGVSQGELETRAVAGRPARHMTGTVSLENDGGFVQMALDLAPDGGAIDARGFDAIELTVRGNGATYNIHLRTADVAHPWQSYRLSFATDDTWRTHRLRLADAEAHRIDAPFDPRGLRRIGLVAIGSEMAVDLALSRLTLAAG